MYDCPISLQELCVDLICNNLDEVFEEYYEEIFDKISNFKDTVASNLEHIVHPIKKNQPKKLKKYIFKQKDLYLYSVISEQILIKLGDNKLLTDSTLSLFTNKNTRLRHVKLKNAEYITVNGLQVLRGHKVEELECCGISIHVNDIIGCLSDWSLENLRTLNISNCTFLDSLRYSGVTSLSRLRSLRRLSVAGTEFPQHGLDIVCHDLKLHSLDVSCTVLTDLTPLALLRPSLQAFTMYNHTHSKSLHLVSTLLSLDNLRYLDLSSDKDESRDCSNVSELLSNVSSLPHLTFLDISGKTSVGGAVLLPWLAEHPHLVWLGVVQCAAAHEPPLVAPKIGLAVAGTASEQQLKEALKHYSSSRSAYVQKCLYHLFRLTPGPSFRDPRPDILQLVLPAMRHHPTQFGVQMAATACLYNLTKGELSQRLHPGLLRHVVQLTLRAMNAFPNHYQLQKNALLTLCSDRVLQDVAFDKFLCAKLVLDCLCAFDDASMNRMSVAVCSILAAKISTEETSKLGSNPAYMRKLLAMVRAKLDQFQVDISMKFTLSALWNLTDESAGTCLVFLQEGGMPLFLQVLHAFPGDSTVETKVLGLLNNIAEVADLRSQLLIDSFLIQLRSLLQSRHIDVSYFAAGIVSHLCCDMEAGSVREEMLDALGEAVANWRPPEQEMVAYRSFRPFFPLLQPGTQWQIMAWATWAVHHVCTKNPKRYCCMLAAEGGVELLQRSLQASDTHPTIRHYAVLVLDAIQSNDN